MTIYFEPTLDSDGITQLLTLLQTDSSSSLVDQKLKDLGFDPDLAISLRNNPSGFTLESLTDILREYQSNYVKDFVQGYKHLERGIVEKSFDLFTQIFLSKHPKGVKGLERHWNLPCNICFTFY